MLQNYFKIAWRSLARNRAFSAINIIGLAIGLASCMLISLYVLDELSFDRYNEKANQIVRVILRGTMQGGKLNEAHVMPPTAQALKADYPEVLAATRLRQGGFPKVVLGEKQYTGDNLVFADSNFFQVFTLPLLKGDTKTALLEPNSLVITQKLANKYFGNADPIGQVINFKGEKTAYKVTGVIEKVPENSHFHFEIFASMAGYPDSKSPSWMTSEYFTYLVLPKGYDYKKLEAKLPQTVEKYMAPQLKVAMGVTMEEFRKSGNNLGLYLQPLTDIHLHSDFGYDLGNNGDIKYVYIFGAVAIIMLVIACINFMNLSTAGASKRAREVGVRKVMGSERKELVYQFLLESILLTSIAMLLAVIFGYLALPLFNTLSGKNLTLQFTAIPSLLPGLILFGLAVGVLAGSYPAFFLSSFKPILVLKGRLASDRKSISLRSGLVVVQFFISITLIIGTTVVYQQLRFIQNKKLGYSKDQVLVMDTWSLGQNKEMFKEELLRDPRVVNVSSSSYIPAGPSNNNNYMVYPDDKNMQLVKTLRYDVDASYIPTLSMEMAAGRNFSKEFGNDSSGVILNETAAAMLGFKKDALDRTITNTNNEGGKGTYRVIGVVKDFHFRSLHERITPLVMILGKDAGNFLVKIKTKEIKGLLADMENKYKGYKSEQPFSYSFLDERFNSTYQAEQKTGSILGIFAGLTIFVASLGLFGLATFTAQQRTKEIGVRKVLGASIGSIVALLSGEFIKLVLVALVLATPVAWYMMTQWLQDFEYRISIEWWVFAVSGLLAIAIALLTVSYQSIKTAMINPVKSIRME
ncbi:ABC transporter permease [Dyadobacter frigoris]|uniref:FtsX-like permease family protein n=1 Tax=Dyadobacter frigoris TaxID=2576211 RepID=A0A4U6CY53_9BACT|nr:ABC transporter permease [Dyadobacter frigoris]TKT88178.1 FtsX-like permease family protein [Dyadobacter frigoris]GLU53795.1 ABC transporter permease [Dyadobacter frigoris]